MSKVEAVVIGAGHAGSEAALALARKGHSVVVSVMNFEYVASMPCNPSVGGPAKGVVVREIDALGGEMARNADKTALQVKLLNRFLLILNAIFICRHRTLLNMELLTT